MLGRRGACSDLMSEDASPDAAPAAMARQTPARGQLAVCRSCCTRELKVEGLVQKPGERGGRQTAASPSAPAGHLQPPSPTAPDQQAASGPSDGVLWVRKDDLEIGPEPDAAAVAAEASPAEPVSQNGSTAGGGVLWVRQDPWESARQPAVPAQNQRAAQPVPETVPGGGKLPPRHGNGAGAKLQPHQPGSNPRLRVQTPAHHSSFGNGHRAAVFDNVE